MIKVDIDGIQELRARLQTMLQRHYSLFKNALDEVGFVVQEAAIRRAPKSPTKEQYLKELNLKRLGRLVQGKKPRKSKSTTNRSDLNPGGLERSIRKRVSTVGGYVDVYVPVNAEAGKYAFRMHEDKYKLGIGSRQKQRGGVMVGRKYIERGAEDKQRDIFDILESFVDDMVTSENRSD